MDIYYEECFLPLNSHCNTRSVWLDYRPMYAKQLIMSRTINSAHSWSTELTYSS